MSYRRRAWGPYTTDQTRIFQTAHAAEAYIAKLEGDGRPDLSPITRIQVHRREVGAWTVVS